MAEYRLTPAAERDLEAIWTYTVQRWGTEQANRYIDVLTTAFSELALTPLMGVERHIIYFRVTAYGIAIIRILHDRMDALRNL